MPNYATAWDYLFVFKDVKQNLQVKTVWYNQL